MMKLTVKSNQSLMDMAVEHCGAFEAVVDLAFANDISITDALETASEIEEVDVFEEKTAKLFGNLYNKPATALTRIEIREFCDAVGFNTADFGTFDYTYDDNFYK